MFHTAFALGKRKITGVLKSSSGLFRPIHSAKRLSCLPLSAGDTLDVSHFLLITIIKKERRICADWVRGVVRYADYLSSQFFDRSTNFPIRAIWNGLFMHECEMLWRLYTSNMREFTYVALLFLDDFSQNSVSKCENVTLVFPLVCSENSNFIENCSILTNLISEKWVILPISTRFSHPSAAQRPCRRMTMDFSRASTAQSWKTSNPMTSGRIGWRINSAN